MLFYTYERSDIAPYPTSVGPYFCYYHRIRDGFASQPEEKRELHIIVEQSPQRLDYFAPSIQVHWNSIVTWICEKEGLPNFLDPAAPAYSKARKVFWYEWWPVHFHGPPCGYDLIEVWTAKTGERCWGHMPAHMHDALLATIASRRDSRAPLPRGF